MEELKVTKDRVLAAANACPQAANTLKTLFPEAFEPAAPELKHLQRVSSKYNGLEGVLIVKEPLVSYITRGQGWDKHFSKYPFVVAYADGKLNGWVDETTLLASVKLL